MNREEPQRIRAREPTYRPSSRAEVAIAVATSVIALCLVLSLLFVYMNLEAIADFGDTVEHGVKMLTEVARNV